MSDPLKVVFVDPAEKSRDELKSLLLGIDSVWIEADCSRYEFFTEIVKSSSPDIAIINLDSDLEKALRTIETIRSSVANCETLAISKSTDGQSILRAIRAGAKEYLNSPVDKQELIDAIARRDYPVVQAGILISALIFIGINLVVDVLYSVVNPRLRGQQ